jgi:hypothetical protein
MKRINETRLRDAEKNAPKPWKRLTVIRTIVRPNGPGGIDGDPIDMGVARIVRTRRNAPPVEVVLDAPAMDLLDADFDAMTDDELMALPHRADE